MGGMKIDAATKRRLAVKYSLDPRTIDKEGRQPGSVRGLPGERARQALAEASALLKGGKLPDSPYPNIP
jgi:hypothetical protein